MHQMKTCYFHYVKVYFRRMEVKTSALKPRPADESVRSVQRAYSILAVFGAELPTASMTQIARLTGLPVSTVSRLLATLEAMDFVRRDGAGQYSLGLRMLQLGIAARHSFNFIDVAEPFLVSLNEATGENANLAVECDAEHFTYVRQLMSRHPIRHASWAGRLLPLKDSANGAALRGRVGPAGYAFTHKTIEPDVCAVAAPIRDGGGTVVGSIGVTGPVYRIAERTLHEYGALVVQAAAKITALLAAHR
jgi:DNA-binding IclR family transcriptional regulator